MQVLQGVLEWVLVGVTSDVNTKRASIQIQDHEGKSHVLSCEGVVAFRASDVLLHNVIESIGIWQADSFEEEAVETLWDLLYGSACNRREEGWQTAVQNAVSETKSGKKTLLKVDPIYGTTVTILAETFSFDGSSVVGLIA